MDEVDDDDSSAPAAKRAKTDDNKKVKADEPAEKTLPVLRKKSE